MDRIEYPATTAVYGIGVARFLRYSYGGLLLSLLAGIIDPKAVKEIVEALGIVLAPLAACTVGAGIYVVHRYVIGELFLFPIVHAVHRGYDYLLGYPGETTSTQEYLKRIGVKWGYRRAAYIAIRRQFFDSGIRERLDITHSELHMLYITMYETILASVYLWMTGDPSLRTEVLLLLGISFFFFAIIGDIRQHQLECLLVKTADDGEKLRPFLEKTGCLLKDAPK